MTSTPITAKLLTENINIIYNTLNRIFVYLLYHLVHIRL